MKNLKYLWLALALIAGFLLGRASITKDSTQHIKLPPVKGSLEIPRPVYTKVPSTPVWPLRPDTLYVKGEPYPVYVTDTVEVFKDYSAEKRYMFNVFDNKDGAMDVTLSLQYNTLQNFDYAFTGVKTVETRTIKRRFEPFASASYHTYGSAGVGGGFFWDRVGVEYMYNMPIKSDISHYHTIGLKIKF